MGYEEPIAAEALRRCENDVEASVCMLCHPGGHEAVVLAVMQRRNALGQSRRGRGREEEAVRPAA